MARRGASTVVLAFALISRSFVETIFGFLSGKVMAGAEKNSLEYDVPWSHAEELDYNIGKMLAAGPTD